MEPKLQLLKKLIDTQRVENEAKKKEQELYSISKDICETEKNLNNCLFESENLRNDIESLENEIANLKITDKILDKELDLIEKSIKDLNKQIDDEENKMHAEKEDFWASVDKFASSCPIEKDEIMEVDEEENLTESTLEKRMLLKSLEGKLRGLELFEKLQQKRLKQIEMVTDITDV